MEISGQSCLQTQGGVLLGENRFVSEWDETLRPSKQKEDSHSPSRSEQNENKEMNEEGEKR
jgi:hypothetical protein